MKFVVGLAAALAFAAIHTVATPAMAQGGAKGAMETGSNATDTKGADMGKMSNSGSKKSKKMKKGKM